MGYVMYLCPTCKKAYKVNGEGKKVKCKACGRLLTDSRIDFEEWSSFDANEKESYFIGLVNDAEESFSGYESESSNQMASLFDVMDSSEENDESARDESISGESVNGENRSDEGRNDVVPVNEQPVASLVSSNPQNILTPVVDTNAIASEVALMLKNNHLKIDLFMVVIALLLPFMGFLIYACNVGSSPKSARKIMIVSLVGAALYVLGYVIYYGVTYGF